MTTQIIYHDFRKASDPTTVTTSTFLLTAPILKKGRRWLKVWAGINAAVQGGCLALCGACIAVTLLIFSVILFG